MTPLKSLWRDAEAAHGILTRTDLLGAGVSPTEVERWRRTGRLVDAANGVYRVAGSPPTFESRALAVVRSFAGETWVSHHSAARLHDLGLDRADGRVEVTRSAPLSAAQRGVEVHRSRLMPTQHTTVLAGIPVTTPARTVFDLARTVGPLRLARVVEQVVERRLASVATLYVVLYELGGRGRPGTRRFREVVSRWDEQEPPLESRLDAVGRALLRPVPGIEWQVRLGDERGHIRTVDALVRPANLVIEFDGAAFHDSPAERELDDSQDRRLVRLGYSVRRFRWADLTRRADLALAEVLRLVEHAA